MKKRTIFMRLNGLSDILTSIYILAISEWGIIWAISVLLGFNNEISNTGNQGADLLLWILTSPIGLLVYLVVIVLILIGIAVLCYSIVQFRYGIVCISRSNKNSDVFYPTRSGIISMMIFQIILSLILTFILIASKSYTNILFITLVACMTLCCILKICILIVSKQEKIYYQNAQQAKANAYRQSLTKEQQALINNAINNTTNEQNTPSDADNNTN